MYLFYDPAQKLVDTFTVIIDKVDKRSSKADKQVITSVEGDVISSGRLSDEITKLHKLLQDGIITEEEFSKMKAKLLQ